MKDKIRKTVLLSDNSLITKKEWIKLWKDVAISENGLLLLNLHQTGLDFYLDIIEEWLFPMAFLTVT